MQSLGPHRRFVFQLSASHGEGMHKGLSALNRANGGRGEGTVRGTTSGECVADGELTRVLAVEARRVALDARVGGWLAALRAVVAGAQG